MDVIKPVQGPGEISIHCTPGNMALPVPESGQHHQGKGVGMELTAELRDLRERLRLEVMQRKRMQQIMIAKTQEARAAVSARSKCFCR